MGFLPVVLYWRGWLWICKLPYVWPQSLQKQVLPKHFLSLFFFFFFFCNKITKYFKTIYSSAAWSATRVEFKIRGLIHKHFITRGVVYNLKQVLFRFLCNICWGRNDLSIHNKHIFVGGINSFMGYNVASHRKQKRWLV